MLCFQICFIVSLYRLVVSITTGVPERHVSRYIEGLELPEVVVNMVPEWAIKLLRSRVQAPIDVSSSTTSDAVERQIALQPAVTNHRTNTNQFPPSFIRYMYGQAATSRRMHASMVGVGWS